MSYGFHDGEIVEDEALVVFLQVDLRESVLCCIVEFDFHKVEFSPNRRYEVNAAMGGVDLDIASGTEKREDDIEHLLPVTFVVDVVAVGNGLEEDLKEAHRSMY